MARLRHIAVCVKDLDKAAEFYNKVFEFKKIGREDLDIGSAIYMSDGVINLALLNFAGAKGSDLKDAKSFEIPEELVGGCAQFGRDAHEGGNLSHLQTPVHGSSTGESSGGDRLGPAFADAHS